MAPDYPRLSLGFHIHASALPPPNTHIHTHMSKGRVWFLLVFRAWSE